MCTITRCGSEPAARYSARRSIVASGWRETTASMWSSGPSADVQRARGAEHHRVADREDRAAAGDRRRARRWWWWWSVVVHHRPRMRVAGVWASVGRGGRGSWLDVERAPEVRGDGRAAECAQRAAARDRRAAAPATPSGVSATSAQQRADADAGDARTGFAARASSAAARSETRCSAPVRIGRSTKR